MAEYALAAGRRVQIEEIGVRPGEKIHETLISPEEMRHAQQSGGIWCVRRLASSEELFPAGSGEQRLASDSARRISKAEIKDLLQRESCLPRL